MDRCVVVNRDFNDVYGEYSERTYLWFDRSKAQAFDEDTRWDGHNNISLATGSQWDHETLYRTAGGKWIIGFNSAYQGHADGYREIGNSEAASWLLRNGYDPEPSCAAEYAALEIS